MLESITIKDFKHTIDIMIKGIYPDVENEFNLLGTIKITYDDVLNQIIFLLIKMEYEKYAEKKSLRQHIENKHGKGSYDDYRWSYMRANNFIKDHKTATFIKFKDKFNIEIKELLPKDMKTIGEKIEGIQLTDVQFSELCMYVGRQKNDELKEIHLLSKEYGHQIESSKKVNEDNFILYFNQYNDYIKNYVKQMTSDTKIIEKTIEYYQLEKAYSIDLSYKIVKEASKRKIKSFSENQLMNILLLVASNINIPPVEWYPYNITYSENWMIFSKFSYVEDLFIKDEIWWSFQLSAFYTSNRLISMILNSAAIDAIIDMFHNKISIKEKSSFITNYYWIFDKHEEYEWQPSKKIRLYRKLKSQLSAYIK